MATSKELEDLLEGYSLKPFCRSIDNLPFDKDAIKRTIGINLELPRPPLLDEDVYYSIDSSDMEDYNPDYLCLSYFDRNFGRVREGFEYFLKSPDRLSLSFRSLYEYQLDPNFLHPLLKEPITVVRGIERKWETDSRGFRLYKSELNIWNMVLAEHEVGKPANYFFLSESIFRPVSESDRVLKSKALWREISRLYIFSGENYLYSAVNSDLLIKEDQKYGHLAKNYIRFPNQIGFPERLHF